MTLTPESIIKIVSDYFFQPVNLVLSTSRKQNHVKCRQVSMYFIRLYCKGMSLSEIGYHFNGKQKFKDHATVLFSVRSVKNEMGNSKSYKKDIEAIALLIGSDEEPKPLSLEEKLRLMFDEKEKVLIAENTHLKKEIMQLKNEISTLKGKIYGLKLARRKSSKKTQKREYLKTALVTLPIYSSPYNEKGIIENN